MKYTTYKMFNKYFLLFLSLVILGNINAKTQTVFVNYGGQDITNTIYSLDLHYRASSASDNIVNTTGIAFDVFFNDAEVSINSYSFGDSVTANTLMTAEVVNDSANLDANTSTNKLLRIAVADANTKFPFGDDVATSATISIMTLDFLFNLETQATTVNFVVQQAAAQYTAVVPNPINFKTNFDDSSALSALEFADIDFDFLSNVFEYSIDVSYAIATIASYTATLVSAHTNTSLVVADSFALAVGSNTLNFVVNSAISNTSSTYRLFINRAMQPNVGLHTINNINTANVDSMLVSGVCSDYTGSITFTVGSISKNAVCNSVGTWFFNVDFSSLAENTSTVTVRHYDKFGLSFAETSQSLFKDTIAPAITGVTDITQQVANDGNTIIINLIAPTAIDLVTGEVEVTNDAPDYYSVGTTTVTWIAIDSFGNEARVEQLVTVSSLMLPIITLKANAINLNAKDKFSSFSIATELGVTFSANSSFSYAVTANGIDLSGASTGSIRLESGTHNLEFSVTDSANNTTTASLVVNVIPFVNLTPYQIVGPNETVTIGVTLSGKAVTYPVELAVNYTSNNAVLADLLITETLVITITSGTSASFEFTTAQQLQSMDDATIAFTIVATTNTFALSNDSYIELTSQLNIPSINLVLMQQQQNTTVMIAGLGNATITLSENLANYSYNWSLVSGNISSQQQGSSLIIDNNAPTGIYGFEFTYSKQGVSTVVPYQLIVIAGAEIIADSNNNGIKDSADDANLATNFLPLDALAAIKLLIQTELEQILALGDIAHSIAYSNIDTNIDTIGAKVNYADLPDALKLTTLANDFSYEYGIDVAVKNLPALGYVTQLVVPLDTTTGFLWQLKVWVNNQWQNYTLNEQDRLFVASREDSALDCPKLDVDSYLRISSAILPAGRNCLKIITADGGANDKDTRANGELRLQAAVFSHSSNSLEINNIALASNQVAAATLQEALRFSVSSTSSNIRINSFNFELGGSSAVTDVSRVQVWQLNSATGSLSNATLVGTGQFNSSKILQLDLDSAIDLSSTSLKYFAVTYDISTLEN